MSDYDTTRPRDHHFSAIKRPSHEYCAECGYLRNASWHLPDPHPAPVQPPALDYVVKLQVELAETERERDSAVNMRDAWEVRHRAVEDRWKMAEAEVERLEGARQERERVYPCADCGVMRSKAEGGAVFTVCDECWNRAREPREEPSR
jgi:hypothetical protein